MIALELKAKSAHYAQFEIRSIDSLPASNVPISLTLFGKHGQPDHVRQFEVGFFDTGERLLLAPPKGEDGSAGGMEVDELLATYERALVEVGEAVTYETAEIPNLLVRWERQREADIVEQQAQEDEVVEVQGVAEALTAEQIEERLTGLFFLMCRDQMPAGAVDGLVEFVIGTEFEYGGSELEGFARRLARAMMGSKTALMTKAKREFIESFPDRVRRSHHFEQVIMEMGDFGTDDKTRAAISAEVVSRQRAARTTERRAHHTGHRDRPEDRHQGLSDPMG